LKFIVNNSFRIAILCPNLPFLHSFGTFIFLSLSSVFIYNPFKAGQRKLSVVVRTTSFKLLVTHILDRTQEFLSTPCVQTGSEAHPASYTIGTGFLFPGVKRGRGVTLTTHPHLVPRLRSRIYILSPLKHLCSVY
jgi:hypothetical protein